MNPSDTRSTPALGVPRRDAGPTPGPQSEVRAGAFPGVVLLRRLPAHRYASRWLARRAGEASALLAYGLEAPGAADSQAMERAWRFRHAHALATERVERPGADGVWLLAPFPGSYDGLLTLSGLMSRRPSGQLGPWEARHAVDHLLSALHAAREHGTPHGEIRPDEVLVDRRSRLQVELCGVEAALHGACPTVRVELLSVTRIASEMLSGVPGLGGASAVRIRGRLGHVWRKWIDAAPDASSAAVAREMLPR